MQTHWKAAGWGALTALVSAPLVLGLAVWILRSVPPQWGPWYDQGELDASMLIVSSSHEECVVALADLAQGLPSQAAVAALECEHRDPWHRRFRYERSPRDPHLGRIFTFASDDREGGADHAEDLVRWIRSDGSLGWTTSRARSDVPEGVDW